jgi:hypothetical protein
MFHYEQQKKSFNVTDYNNHIGSIRDLNAINSD